MINSSTCSPKKTAKLKSVAFYGDHVSTVQWQENHFVALKPIVETLGLAWGSQTEKLEGERYSVIRIPCGTPGGTQPMLCIPLKKLNGWLFSINPNKVRSDLKDTLIRYQEECFDVLYRYWSQPKEYPPEYDSPFDRINHRTMYELRRVNPKLVQAYLVDRGITPQLVHSLLMDQTLLEQSHGPQIMPIGQLKQLLKERAHPYDANHLFLFQDDFRDIMGEYDPTATLNHLRNAGILWPEEGRLTRKISKTIARQFSNGERQRVYVFNHRLMEA